MRFVVDGCARITFVDLYYNVHSLTQKCRHSRVFCNHSDGFGTKNERHNSKIDTRRASLSRSDRKLVPRARCETYRNSFRSIYKNKVLSVMDLEVV